LKTQKESFINRLRQILISQIELLSVLEIDDALPEEAIRFLENAKTRKKIALKSDADSKTSSASPGSEPETDIEFAEESEVKSPEADKDKSKEQKGKREEKSEPEAADKKEDADVNEKVDDEINEFFKKEIQIDELMKDIQKKDKK